MKATYLLPLWVDIKCDNPKGAIKGFNTLLAEALEDVTASVSGRHNAEIDVSWSVNQNIGVKGD